MTGKLSGTFSKPAVLQYISLRSLEHLHASCSSWGHFNRESCRTEAAAVSRAKHTTKTRKGSGGTECARMLSGSGNSRTLSRSLRLRFVVAPQRRPWDYWTLSRHGRTGHRSPYDRFAEFTTRAFFDDGHFLGLGWIADDWPPKMNGSNVQKHFPFFCNLWWILRKDCTEL